MILVLGLAKKNLGRKVKSIHQANNIYSSSDSLAYVKPSSSYHFILSLGKDLRDEDSGS